MRSGRDGDTVDGPRLGAHHGPRRGERGAETHLGADDLERVRARECTQQVVQRAARLSLAAWQLEQDSDGAVLRGELRLRRGDTAQALAVEDFGGNVLWDPHALAESKQSYVFRLYRRGGRRTSRADTVRADEKGSWLLDELTARTRLPGR